MPLAMGSWRKVIVVLKVTISVLTATMLLAGCGSGLTRPYYIMLEPLPPGEHMIKYRAKVVLPAVFPNVQQFGSPITFRLTVQ